MNNQDWQQHADKAGWWIAKRFRSRKMRLMDVRRLMRSGTLLYGKLDGETSGWHIAYLFNGRVFGPFKSRKAATEKMKSTRQLFNL